MRHSDIRGSSFKLTKWGVFLGENTPRAPPSSLNARPISTSWVSLQRIQHDANVMSCSKTHINDQRRWNEMVGFEEVSGGKSWCPAPKIASPNWIFRGHQSNLLKVVFFSERDTKTRLGTREKWGLSDRHSLISWDLFPYWASSITERFSFEWYCHPSCIDV